MFSFFIFWHFRLETLWFTTWSVKTKHSSKTWTWSHMTYFEVLESFSRAFSTFSPDSFYIWSKFRIIVIEFLIVKSLQSIKNKWIWSIIIFVWCNSFQNVWWWNCKRITQYRTHFITKLINLKKSSQIKKSAKLQNRLVSSISEGWIALLLSHSN